MGNARTIEWSDGTSAVRIIDQTQLPLREATIECRDVESLIEAIESLRVRGAPALAVAGALGVALAMSQGEAEGWDASQVESAVMRIRAARPTAVNLSWGVDQVSAAIPFGVSAVLRAAKELIASEEWANRRISTLGADWILTHVGQRPLRILTHCNTGALCATETGTALGVVLELHRRGCVEVVYVDETRPLLQGSRLTAWELARAGVPYLIQADSAAASTVFRGLVDLAIIGADRIALNGDAVNKIGSLPIALACSASGVPFVVAAPRSTFDQSTHSGDEVEIELREESEITHIAGLQVAPVGARAFNPAFDVTPNRFITAIVSEDGVESNNVSVTSDEAIP